MAEFRTDGGGVLCKDLVRKVFEYDDHAEEARAACIAKGWGDVRRGPAPSQQMARTLKETSSISTASGPGLNLLVTQYSPATLRLW